MTEAVKKKILLTGAGGFIGSALAKYLTKCGMETVCPSSAKLDVAQQASVANFPMQGIDHMIHLAGRTFVPKSWEEPEEFIKTNTFGTLNLLEVCRRQKISMTYISAYIYGMPKKNPIPETALVNPNNPYAKSKYMAEELCEFYAEQFGVGISVIRPFNVYGIGQRDHFLIPQIIRQATQEESICVMDLEPKRDYIYLTDLLEAIRLTLQRKGRYEVFNIGSGVSYSVAEVISMIQRIAGTQKPVICKNEVRRNEMNDVIADISKAKEVLGWKPAYTLEQGLTEIIKGKRNELER